VVDDGPFEQFGIEGGQLVGIRCFNGAAPPHTRHPSAHVVSLFGLRVQSSAWRSSPQPRKCELLDQSLLGMVRTFQGRSESGSVRRNQATPS
jgi:hypothetical protein